MLSRARVYNLFKEYIQRVVSMKNKAIILIIVIAGFLAALYLMGYIPFGDEPEELDIGDFSVKSNDESAELFIPKDALPDDVDLNDISITKVSNDLTENGTWVVYHLEPDGLVFTEEVLFNVTLESVNDAIPIVFISNGNGMELVNNTFTDIDLANHTQTVSIPLTHFSEIRLHGPDVGAFSLKFSVQKQDVGTKMPGVLVGDKVNTVASFTFLEDWMELVNSEPSPGYWVYEILKPQVIYRGTWINLGNSIFTPKGEFGGKPRTTQVDLGQTNTVQDDALWIIHKVYFAFTLIVPTCPQTGEKQTNASSEEENSY